MQKLQSLRTRDASEYLKSLGLPASPRYLEKCRARGEHDDRDRGPDFLRDERGICWYSKAALDQYAAVRLAARVFRAPAAQPLNFRARRGASQIA